MSTYLDTLEPVASGVVADHAVEVDRTAAFPHDSISALREAGLLGLISGRDCGGVGEGPRGAALAVERLARECGSTAMVLCMHYAASAVVERFADTAVRRKVAEGEHLLTLAFSEQGSRSHFWAPVSQAVRSEEDILLTARKSWVTSANHCSAYVWSSRPVSAEGASTVWFVPSDREGLVTGPAFDGLGLRGNDSTPVQADGVVVGDGDRLGPDGEGLEIMLGVVLPVFNLMTAGCSIGFMEAAIEATRVHVSSTQFQHLDRSLRDFPTVRAYLARMRVSADQVRCLWLDAIQAAEEQREDALLRLLECKAAAGETATQVLDTAMRVCGGAAFRREVGVERRFRDARAATVMAPTTDQLYDFIGKALCGLDVF